ncbi:MAG: hypothetical protein LBN40_00535, partial [Oscillospiraceae bacterium]|nr:hypothetical protein [Oscillospiraceae bacterium]
PRLRRGFNRPDTPVRGKAAPPLRGENSKHFSVLSLTGYINKLNNLIRGDSASVEAARAFRSPACAPRGMAFGSVPNRK